MQRECYGSYSKQRDTCKQCELRDYCRDAGDIPLLQNIGEFARDVDIDRIPAADNRPRREKPKYTRSDVLHVARIILNLEHPGIRVILKMKMRDPDISLSQIGDQFGITKQAIYKTICRYCDTYPFLSGLLQNRPLYNRWRPYKRQPFPPLKMYKGGKFREALIRQGLYRPPMIQPELEHFPDCNADPDNKPDQRPKTTINPEARQ